MRIYHGDIGRGHKDIRVSNGDEAGYNTMSHDSHEERPKTYIVLFTRGAVLLPKTFPPGWVVVPLFPEIFVKGV